MIRYEKQSNCKDLEHTARGQKIVKTSFRSVDCQESVFNILEQMSSCQNCEKFHSFRQQREISGNQIVVVVFQAWARKVF